MPRPYQVWLRQAAYDYLDTLPESERQRLLIWIERLGQQPHRAGDFTEHAAGGRERQVAIVGEHAVGWWVDGAVCEVKVEAIRSADL